MEPMTALAKVYSTALMMEEMTGFAMEPMMAFV